MSGQNTAPPPALRVVRGDPSPHELAALIAVVSARNAAAAAVPRGRSRSVRSEWGHPARAHLQRPRVGPDQWRRSAWAR